MNVLSLFDGMSCGQQALEKTGIIIDNYFASEVDKYAIKVTQHNYPNTKQLGDVRVIDTESLPIIHLLIGGSPCQSFSFAGKRKGMLTKDNIEILTIEHYLELKQQGFEFEGQSYLFWEYIRVLIELRKNNPDIKFLLENVMMGDKWQKILTQAIGINPIEINSALVSSQNRRRLYWTNIGTEPDGLFGDLVCKIPQPKDKCIFLKDILEMEVYEKYYLSGKSIQKLIEYQQRQKESGNGFTTKFHNESEKMSTLKIGGGGCDDLIKVVKLDINGNLKNNQNKASCFTAGAHQSGHHSDMDLIIHNMMPLNGDPLKGGTGHLTRTDGKTYCLDTGNTNAVEIVAMCGRENEVGTNEQQLEKREDGKTNCLTSVQKDNLIFTKNYLQWDESGKGYKSQQDRAFYEDGKHGTDSAMRTENKCNVLLNTNRIRRLTPMECERLQTVKDNYTSIVSDTQRYKMLGNGWTIDVIAHIFSYLLKT